MHGAGAGCLSSSAHKHYSHPTHQHVDAAKFVTHSLDHIADLLGLAQVSLAELQYNTEGGGHVVCGVRHVRGRRVVCSMRGVGGRGGQVCGMCVQPVRGGEGVCEERAGVRYVVV